MSSPIPLNYLIRIRCEHILPALYIRVFVPTAVIEELNHPRTVPAVRDWLAQVPPWLIVRDVAFEADPARGLIDIDCALTDLHATDFRCSARVMEEVRRQAKLLS